MKKGRVMRPFAVLAERVGFEPTSDFSLPDFEFQFIILFPNDIIIKILIYTQNG